MSKDLIIQITYCTDYLKNRMEKVSEESKKSSMPMAYQAGVYAGLLNVTIKNLAAWRKALMDAAVAEGDAFCCEGEDCERFIWTGGDSDQDTWLCPACLEKARAEDKAFKADHSAQMESGV